MHYMLSFTKYRSSLGTIQILHNEKEYADRF